MSYPIRKLEIPYPLYHQLHKALGQPPVMPVAATVNHPDSNPEDPRWGILIFLHRPTGPQGILLVSDARPSTKPESTNLGILL